MGTIVRIAYRKTQASKYMIEVKNDDGTWIERYRFTKKQRAQDLIDHFYSKATQEGLYKYV